MTDNPQWQEGQPPPPPPNNPEPHGTAGQPYAGGPAQPPNAPQQGDGWQNQQGQPQHGQPQGGWQGQPAYQHTQQASGDERTWMILAHVSAPIAFIVSAGWLSFVGPLLVWLFKKDSSPKVRQAAAGAFNFNLTFWLLYLLGWVVAIFTLGLGFVVAIPFWILIFLVAAYVHIKGAIRASRGETYRYPFQLPVLS
ncbi:DUF4870 domain-containing protein [Ornithinimicrobium faecis]|uniref:DUF4870 domain-containing protein n=1 Tax=Ornithinimicrobium faecis TaxID=2934158 RepID=UPI002118AAD7|nr:DUF4870 domain-containing protein [Ornithinimicrobium sp. HY1745]